MPDIVVQDITPRNQYTAGGGGPTVFAFTFPIFALTDVVVYRTPVGSQPDDVAQILVYNIGYTVINNVPPAVGGTITLTMPANTGDIITIVRDLPDNRLNNYIDGGLFQATDVNTDFDRTVMMSQQDKMYDKVLGIHYNNSAVITPVVDNILPLLPPNYIWMKNGTNTEIIAVPFGSGGGSGVVSITTTLPIVGGPIIVAGNISLANSGIVAGTYSPGQVTFDAHGLATSAIQLSSLSGKNFVTNGDFQIWQAGTSFTGLTFGVVAYVADMWEGDGENVPIAYSITRQASGLPGGFVARVKRDTGSATVGQPTLNWSSPIASVAGIAGNYLTLSFKARAGANFSAPNSLGIVMYSGTGNVDQSFFFSGTGWTGNTSVLSEVAALTSTLTTYTFTTSAPLGATVTQLAVQFYFSGGCSGVAGANDYFDVTDVQVEIGRAATPFNRPSFNQSLAACQFLYFKTFAYATTPAQNVGAQTGEFFFPATKAGAAINFSQTVFFPQPLNEIPAITFYNPAAANAQIRDESSAADFTLTSTFNLKSSGFVVIGTGAAGTGVGNACGVHFVADSRLKH